ncbi:MULTISPECIES: hypothetical protein [Halorussus]|uniref:hypothetical protein n=1 Tax=Halorussus TaxID=1070314 RepID=UPI00209E151F|nr:hypothetical protein [Halorussus vallis]USZ75084.1 hypothetical protein NGM07_16815 [Halorussus vallis]
MPIDNLHLLVSIAVLGTLVPRSRTRSDRLALTAGIVGLAAAFVVTNLPSVPHLLVLGVSVAGLVVCLGAFSTVAYTRLRGRRRAA